MDAASQLKKFVDVGKKNTRLLGSVERYIMAKPADLSRRTDVLHPSEMVQSDWCYRASYFQLLGAPPIENRAMTLGRATVFAEGHIIHSKWQGWLKGMGVLWGSWYCYECEEYFWGLPDCHDGPIAYREVPLYYEPLRISGSADGWIKGVGADMMLEIKSVGMGTLRYECPELLAENNYDFEATWKAIKAPFMKHIMQVQLYMKLAELKGMESPEEAIIIYEAKPNQEAKEFVIPKGDFGITPLLDAAAMIVDAVKNQTPPECNIASGGCAKCKGYK